MGRQQAHADLTYMVKGTDSGVPKSNYLSVQTPFPEVNVGSFGKGRNSVKVQLTDGQLEDTIKLKRDREYIRRIIKDSKKTSRFNSEDGDIADECPKEESKLKWNRQENRFTHRPEHVREGPSKDHDEAKYFLEVRRLQKEREKDGYQPNADQM